MASKLHGAINAHTSLCNAFLAHINCLPSPVPKRALLLMGQDILYHADQAEKETRLRHSLILKELYEVSQTFLTTHYGETKLQQQNYALLDELKSRIEAVGLWGWLFGSR